ncbi:hypothetical protein DAA51_33150 [Bradyrhizobium sp. WBAH10]|nr:hypothetical protein [Bradyrhizobium sp. WBAH30]MDD1546039.1 hypothetical protein [Bradyrhizobium sp. WBAH41]MDD1559241.1 hypothetical protein [Bradyrhizobium sp. WBAH23]MDD1592632.1 hypothetical protein [Bradyrhizobium sp. WBAH42]NRB90164.1 hypothetical protein [Bradyrhizobium sp. WBAH10]QCJ92835.1 hypothetical protein DAA57_33395 [Bradyrhizobium yuanmingense]
MTLNDRALTLLMNVGIRERWSAWDTESPSYVLPVKEVLSGMNDDHGTLVGRFLEAADSARSGFKALTLANPKIQRGLSPCSNAFAQKPASSGRMVAASPWNISTS